MPAIQHSFVVDCPLDKVWSLLSDFEKFGSQLPHVVEVKYLDSSRTTSKWQIKGSIGPVSKSFSVTVNITEQSLSDFLKFRGEGTGLRIEGKTAAETISPSQTRISVNFNVEASGGIVGSFVNQIIEKQLPRDIEESEKKIRSLLEVRT
jgi:carbon monoxide dehydrogenase subunit G